MADETLTQRLMMQMAANAPSYVTLQLPPPVFVGMEGEFIAFAEGESLTARFPVRKRHRNPMGYMQGGMIAAAIDNTIGPLSFLLAPPSVTTHLHTTFVRPITADDKYIVVEARLIEATRSYLYLTARVANPAGKTAALANATCRLLDR